MIHFLRTASKTSLRAFSTTPVAGGISSEMQTLLDLFQKKQSLQIGIDKNAQDLLVTQVLENDTRYRANQTIMGLRLHQTALKEQLAEDQAHMLELDRQIEEAQAKTPEFRKK